MPENPFGLIVLEPIRISSSSLIDGFRVYNKGLEVPAGYQERVDDILDFQTREVAPELADHGRRVGGYAGAVLRSLEHPIFSDQFHEGLIRIAGAVHDIGKVSIKREVLYRSLGWEGFGKFIWEEDGENMMKHPVAGGEIIINNPEELPPEAFYASACHHRYTDPFRRAYGTELDVINRENINNPIMVDWLHLMVKIVNLADYFDAATSRDTGYFNSTDDKNVGIFNRAKILFPGKEAQVIDSLRAEQRHYLGLVDKLAA